MENFDELAATYKKMIYSLIHSLHVYKNQDEFYQIGLIALWDASKNFDEEKGVQFSTYVYRFIKGRLQNHLSSESKREEHCTYASEEYWNSLECEINLLEKETLLNNFHHLSELQKKWVLLHFYDGLKNSDIAHLLNVKVSTVRGWEREAMKKCTLGTVLLRPQEERSR